MSIVPVNRTQAHPFYELEAQLESQANHTPYLKKFCQAIKLVKQNYGMAPAAATSVGVMAAAIYTAVFSYFCLEGAFRSLEEAYHIYHENGSLAQSLGDAGGWISLPIFSLFTFYATSKQLLREVDYAKVEKRCKKWYLGNRNIPLDEFYERTLFIVDAVAKQCFFYKSVVKNQVSFLSLIENLNPYPQQEAAAKLNTDIRLKLIYQTIQQELDKELSLSHYFHRLLKGLVTVKKQSGYLSMLSHAISGIGIPLILNTTCFLSAIGEVALGKKLFGRREDLPEVGHFGEWPDNLVGAALFSYFLNQNLLVKGDLSIMQDVFQNHINKLDIEKLPLNKLLHARLCEVANQEIDDFLSRCYFPQQLKLSKFE